jgi:hypothetical protein
MSAIGDMPLPAVDELVTGAQAARDARPTTNGSFDNGEDRGMWIGGK